MHLKGGLKLSANFVQRKCLKLCPSPGHCTINLRGNFVCHELTPAGIASSRFASTAPSYPPAKSGRHGESTAIEDKALR
jgi:hypothetical protein